MFLDFQGFSLDFTNRQLKVNGKLVEVDDRVFPIFDLLITSYPDSCTKQQLLDAAWPDTVVSEWSLSKLISDTRKMFKNAGYDGPLLQTIHGKGYRLPVELAKQLQQPDKDSPKLHVELTKQVTTKRPIKLMMISLLVFVVILVSALQIYPRSLITQEPVGAKSRILWVDDNPTNNEREREYFEDNKIAVYAVESTEEALRLMSLYQYHVVISDMGRQDDKLAGLRLLEQIRALNNQTPFILYTWHSTPELVQEIDKLGGQGVAIDSVSLYDFVNDSLTTNENPQ